MSQAAGINLSSSNQATSVKQLDNSDDKKVKGKDAQVKQPSQNKKPSINFDCSHGFLTSDMLQAFAEKHNSKTQIQKEKDEWDISLMDIINPLNLMKKLSNRLFNGKGDEKVAKQIFKTLKDSGIHIRDSYTFPTEDGYKARVFYAIESDPATTPTLVFVPGRGSGIEAFKSMLKRAAIEKFNVICLLPRGSYGNPGIAHKDGMVKDFVGMIKGANERLGIPLENMEIWAHSLGTMLTTHGLAELAKQSTGHEISKISRVNLITPALSQLHSSKHFTKILPEGLIKLFSGDNLWDSAKAIENLGSIVESLNINGAKEDWVTPPDEIIPALEKAMKRAGVKGNVAISPNADHHSAIPN